MDLFYSFLKLILGLSFFIFGMNVMSSNLSKMAGGKLEQLLKKVTSNKLIAILLGAGITIAIQSSSASTVMLVGLVNSGIMELGQTLGVVFGANIGTTLTSWILSLSGIESSNIFISMLKPENFSPILALIGVVMIMMCKSDKKKSLGTIFVGFAVLMYGMEFMTDAVSPISNEPWFVDFLASVNNPLVGVLIGTVCAGIIQSSAAGIGMVQAISLSGGLTHAMAMPIVMGMNIGTCVTSLISAIGTKANAKRVAVMHLSINIIGTVICMAVYLIVDALFPIEFMQNTTSPLGVAIIHSVFNIVTTIVLMPAGSLLVKLVKLLVRDDKEEKSGKEAPIFQLDDLLLRSPSVAIRECDAYTVKMGDIAHSTLLSSISLYDNYNLDVVKEVIDNEEKVDMLEDSLGTYLVRLSAEALSNDDSQRISKMLHTIGDFERLSDHAVNLQKVFEEMNEKQISFSPEARKEIAVLTGAITEILNITYKAYSENDIALAATVEPLEQVIDNLTSRIKNNHITRLQNGVCTIELGFVLADLINNYERISDHCSNIAVAMIELQNNSFDTHHYLNEIKYGGGEFDKNFKSFSEKYAIEAN